MSHANPSRRPHRRLTLASLALLPAAACGRIAFADARLWDGNNAVPPSGRFATGTNWIGNVAPIAADGAIFNVGPAANYVVTFFSQPTNPIPYETDYLRVGSNTVTFQNTPGKTSYTLTRTTTTENARGIIVGEMSGEAAVLNTQMPFAGHAATLGDGGGATGTLNVSASAFTIYGDSAADAELIVGNHGAGRLNISGGAQVNLTGARGNSIIGNHPGSDGRVTVNASTWQIPHDLDVGGFGAGTLTITGGGRASNARATIASGDGGIGAVNVSGAGSSWGNADLRVGYLGAGALNVSAGAQVTCANALIDGFSAPATGAVTVTGAGSTWNLVNLDSTGTLDIKDGARVTCADAYLRGGAVTVDGPSSVWTVNGPIHTYIEELSAFGTGRVILTNGGTAIVGGNFLAGINITSTEDSLTLDGGTLDMTGHEIGSGSPFVSTRLTFLSGTLRNVAQVNQGFGLEKKGAGTLILDGSNTYTGSTYVGAGTLIYKTSYTTGTEITTFQGIVRLADMPQGIVLKTGEVQVALNGKLDLTDNKLIVPSGDLAALTAQVKSAYHGGLWDGPGITSSTITPTTALGIVRAGDVGLVGNTFGGVPVAAGDVLVMYTLAADTNLDALVDFNDLVRLAQNYNTTGTDWPRGDFNYDGATNFTDLVKLAQNYNTALPAEPIPGAPADFAQDLAAAFAAVPEPAGFATCAACGLSLLSRRSRRCTNAPLHSPRGTR